MPPLTGLRSYPLSINPYDIYSAGIAGYERAGKEEDERIQLARHKLFLMTEKQDLEERTRALAEKNRPAQTVRLGAPAIPGIAAGPNAAPAGGGQLLSLEEAPQGMTPGVPARTQTVQEFPRYENPMQFEQRRRQEQSKVDMKQADAEAQDRYAAGDMKGFHDARARAYGYAMEVYPEQRGEIMRLRNDELKAGVELQKRGIVRNELAPKLIEDFKKLETSPLDRQPWWHAMELAANSDDPEILRPYMMWLQNEHQAYMAKRIKTEEGVAIGKVEGMLLQKFVERGDARIPLDEAEYRKIALEVMKALPTEVAIYNEAVLAGKGQVPAMFMKLFHQELGGSKEYQLSQKAMQQARADLGPDADPAAVATRADQLYAMWKRGETPAAQDMKLRLQEHTLKLQEERTGKERAIAQYYRERSHGGAAGVTKETLHALAMSREIFAKRLDALPQSQFTEAERVEQAKILKQDIKDLDAIIQEHNAAMKGGGAAKPSSPGATSPAGPAYSSRADDLVQRAKALWQREHPTENDKTGSWKDPAVAEQYVRRVQGAPQTP